MTAGHSYTAVGNQVIQVVVGLAASQAILAQTDDCVFAPESTKVATVTKVTVISDSKDVKKIFGGVLPVFAKNITEFQTKTVGPYNDPKKTGNVAMVNWIVIQGENLDDLEVKRYSVATFKNAAETLIKPDGSKGYVAKQEIGIKNSLPDGPGAGNVWVSGSKKFLVVADTPGVGNVTDVYPASLNANFYLNATSKIDKTSKAQVWYDVNIATSAPGKVETNKLTIIKQIPK